MENDIKNDNKMTFESSYNRLDEIALKLENEKTTLDESFKLYEEGQSLLKRCNNMLDKAEKRLKILTEDDEGIIISEETID